MADEDRYLAHLCGLADNPNLPEHLLDKLVAVTSGELDAGEDLFGVPRTEVPEMADAPAIESTGEVLARRTDLPEWVYHQLATDKRLWVRLYLARNPAVPEGLLWTLADDRAVRPELAWNPVVPVELLAEIATTADLPPVLLPRVAAANPAELRSLAASPSWQVRALVGLHDNLPRDVVDRLIADPDLPVVQALVAAKNPRCSPALLHSLARRAEAVCPQIAQHPNTDADTLMLCLRVPAARRHAARHPNLPPDVATGLLDDPDLLVAEAAAANPALPRKIMEAVLAECL
ncbi:hypothetical protein KIPE111705_26150 [Kibdelosporangium persicum]|uniref:Leucine rich repeat variant n=1 Tax=Kibdelosporangium persicum TaxID=2698649 RepID=A0ABX2F3D4_9PSEU|nr:hypothetical protein [Kibdelosporangium persicum]NRN65510.1 Leucine rich repeat variant [Kibdelosporangium persicum]